MLQTKAICNYCGQVLADKVALRRGYDAECWEVFLDRYGFKKPEPETKGLYYLFLDHPLIKEGIIFQKLADGRVATNVPWSVVYHSPTGFSWGYAGSGVADFALNIAAMFLELDKAYLVHQNLKWRFLVKIPKDDGGMIPVEDILNWIKMQDGVTISDIILHRKEGC